MHGHMSVKSCCNSLSKDWRVERVARGTLGDISDKIAGNENIAIVRGDAQTRKLTTPAVESLGQLGCWIGSGTYQRTACESVALNFSSCKVMLLNWGKCARTVCYQTSRRHTPLGGIPRSHRRKNRVPKNSRNACLYNWMPLPYHEQQVVHV
jgi:hypothetical protein